MTFQHGGNRLGANSLFAIYGGMVAGPNVEYVVIETSYTELDEELYQKRIDEDKNHPY